MRQWSPPRSPDAGHPPCSCQGSKAKTIEDFKKAYIEEIQKNPYRVDIFSTGAYISVDLIRSMTSSFAMKGDRIRTIVLAEADRMNESAANAFLKTLEDVPANTYFILTTSSREKMLQTIRSRCLALHLLPLSDDEVRSEVLRVAGEEFDETSLTDDVIGLAVGSPGKALYYAEHAKSWCKLASDFVILTASWKSCRSCWRTCSVNRLGLVCECPKLLRR